MLGIDHPLSFLLAASLVIVVPGPATFYVLGKALHSARNATRATAGIVAGDVVLITLSGLGFAALVSRWPVLLTAIKVGGALYVGYLGIELLRARPTDDGRTHAPEPSGGFFRGLLVTLTNPKPILFFGAFFPMFIAPTSASWLRSFYLLGGLFELINLAYFSAAIGAVSGLREVAFFERLATGGLNRVSGYGLVLCGALILTTAFAR